MNKEEWISHIESVLSTVGSYETEKITIHKPNLQLDYYMVYSIDGKFNGEYSSLSDIVDWLDNEEVIDVIKPITDLDPDWLAGEDGKLSIGEFHVNTMNPAVVSIRLNKTCELNIMRTDEGIVLDVWDWSNEEINGPIFSDYYFDGELTGEE